MSASSCGVSQGLFSCGHGGWHSLGGSLGHVSQGGVRMGGNLPLQVSSVLATDEGETGTFSSTPLKFLMFSSLLQMDSTKQTLTGQEAQTAMRWSQRTLSCSSFGLCFITGQRIQNPPHRGNVVTRPCLVCSALGAPALGALWCQAVEGPAGRGSSELSYGREGGFPRDVDKGKTLSKVCS